MTMDSRLLIPKTSQVNFNLSVPINAKYRTEHHAIVTYQYIPSFA